MVGSSDPQLILSADLDGSYIGEIDGEKVCYMNSVRYPGGDTYYIGFFIISPNYRGRGYASAFFKYVWSIIDKKCNKMLWSTKNLCSVYKEYGFHFMWREYLFIYSSSKVAKTIGDIKTEYEVRSVNDVCLDKLTDFDKLICSENRKSLLQKFSSIPDCTGLVAIDKKGNISGYCFARKMINSYYGWWLAPLFALNEVLARLLLKRVAEIVSITTPSSSPSRSPSPPSSSCSDQEVKLAFYVPEVNHAAMHIAQEELKLCDIEVEEDGSLRMCTGKYTGNMDHVYALTSVDIG